MAAPTITNASISGGTLTLSVTDPGTKSPAAPLFYDDFEDGVVGEKVSTSDDWEDYVGGADYSNTVAYTGLLSAHASIVGGDGFDSAYTTFASTDTIYYSCMFYTTGDNYETGVYKNSRLTSSGSSYSGIGVTGSSQNYVFYNPEDGTGWSYMCTLNDPCCEEGTGRYFSTTYDDKWTRQTTYVELSSPGGTANGYLQAQMGTQTQTFSGLVNRQTGETYGFTQALMGLMHDDGNHDSYIGEVYIDTTQARIEIINGDDWDTATKQVIQLPVTWGTTTTATIRQGDLADTGNYVVIINSDGEASNTYPITFVAGEGSTSFGTGSTAFGTGTTSFA